MTTKPEKWSENLRRVLFKSETDIRLAGVCGGIGQRFSVDPNVIRLGMTLTFFMMAFTVSIYAALAIAATYAVAGVILPEGPEI